MSPITPSPRRALLALAVGLTLAACSMDADDTTPDSAPPSSPSAAQVRIGEIDWYVDYAAAQAAARAVDKPLWVHFGEHPG